MEGLEQGRLRLTGLPCQGPPFALWISQGFNCHGKMKAGVWIPEEAGKEIHTDMRVALEFTGEGSAPVFCGVVKKKHSREEEGPELPLYRSGNREQPPGPGKEEPLFPETGAQLPGAGGGGVRPLPGISRMEKGSGRGPGVRLPAPI